MIGRNVEVVALDFVRHFIVTFERDRLAAMLEEAPIRRGRLHHAAARREIAGQHRGRALAVEGRRQRMNDVGQEDFRAGDIVAERAAGDGEAA